jgi:hypothetical protein
MKRKVFGLPANDINFLGIVSRDIYFLKDFKIKSVNFVCALMFSLFKKYITVVIFIVKFLLASIKLLSYSKIHRYS